MVDSQRQGMKTGLSTFSAMILGGCCILYQVSKQHEDDISQDWGLKSTSLGLVKPVRAVAFSPGCRLLAAAGDSKVIALYDVSSGEQVANLIGNGAWIFSLDWSDTGEYLLSG